MPVKPHPTDPESYVYQPPKYDFLSQPKYVGGYQIGGPLGLKINFQYRPIWLHRVMMRLCLGWKWIDNKENT